MDNARQALISALAHLADRPTTPDIDIAIDDALVAALNLFRNAKGLDEADRINLHHIELNIMYGTTV